MSLKLTAKKKPDKWLQRETIVISVWGFKGRFSGANSKLVLGTVSSYLDIKISCLIGNVGGGTNMLVWGRWRFFSLRFWRCFFPKRNRYPKTTKRNWWLGSTPGPQDAGSPPPGIWTIFRIRNPNLNLHLWLESWVIWQENMVSQGKYSRFSSMKSLINNISWNKFI